MLQSELHALYPVDPVCCRIAARVPWEALLPTIAVPLEVPIYLAHSTCSSPSGTRITKALGLFGAERRLYGRHQVAGELHEPAGPVPRPRPYRTGSRGARCAVGRDLGDRLVPCPDDTRCSTAMTSMPAVGAGRAELRRAKIEAGEGIALRKRRDPGMQDAPRSTDREPRGPLPPAAWVPAQ